MGQWEALRVTLDNEHRTVLYNVLFSAQCIFKCTTIDQEYLGQIVPTRHIYVMQLE